MSQVLKLINHGERERRYVSGDLDRETRNIGQVRLITIIGSMPEGDSVETSGAASFWQCVSWSMRRGLHVCVFRSLPRNFEGLRKSMSSQFQIMLTCDE